MVFENCRFVYGIIPRSDKLGKSIYFEKNTSSQDAHLSAKAERSGDVCHHRSSCNVHRCNDDRYVAILFEKKATIS